MLLLPSTNAPPPTDDLLLEVLQDPVLIRACKAFLNSSTTNVPAHLPTLYAHQAECIRCGMLQFSFIGVHKTPKHTHTHTHTRMHTPMYTTHIHTQYTHI